MLDRHQKEFILTLLNQILESTWSRKYIQVMFILTRRFFEAKLLRLFIHNLKSDVITIVDKI